MSNIQEESTHNKGLAEILRQSINVSKAKKISFIFIDLFDNSVQKLT